MKTKHVYILLCLAACVGFGYWTVYLQTGSHPVESWLQTNGKPSREGAVEEHPHLSPESVNWPVVRRRYLPNYFLMLEGDNSPSLFSYRDSNIVFLHHNKAGGLTIRKCMIQIGKESALNVSRNVLSYRYTAREFDYWAHAARTRKRVALYGGYSFGACDVFNDGRPCSYFTMIRNPYDRVVSAYLYCSKNTSTDQLCTALKASEVSVVDWAMHHGSFFFRQLMMNPSVCNGSYDNSVYLRNIDDIPHKFTEYMDGIPCWFKHKVLLERMFTEEDRAHILQHYLDNLENYFSVVGLLEHFDLTLSMLQHVYHVPFRDRCAGNHYNKRKLRTPKQKRDADGYVARLKQELLTDPRVNKSLHEDLLLYHKAQSIFTKQAQIYSRLMGNNS